MDYEKIKVEVAVNASIQKVWNYWNQAHHVKQWNNASPDWHTPKAENNVTVGGKFVYTMAAKDGSFSFEFSGVYTAIALNKLIEYKMDDGRSAKIEFIALSKTVQIIETFDAETENTLELQKFGWQAILDNFKQYVENN